MMASKAQEIAFMVDMLPEQDQVLAYELVKKLVLAWDPDFTKITDEESAHIRAAQESGFIPAYKVGWDDLGQYAR